MAHDPEASAALAAARSWVRRHSPERIDMVGRSIRDHFEERPAATPIALAVIQMLLKHRELAGDMLTAYGREHHATAMVLVRPILEGSLVLRWALLGDDDERYRRLLRFANDTSPPAGAEPPEHDVVAEEWSTHGLRRLPNVKDLVGALNRHAADRSPSVPPNAIPGSQLWSHYGLLSEYSHARGTGPALFSVDEDADFVVWPQAQGVDGTAAMHLGMLYAAESYVAACELGGLLGELAYALESYGPVVAATERTLAAALGFDPDGDRGTEPSSRS